MVRQFAGFERRILVGPYASTQITPTGVWVTKPVF